MVLWSDFLFHLTIYVGHFFMLTNRNPPCFVLNSCVMFRVCLQHHGIHPHRWARWLLPALGYGTNAAVNTPEQKSCFCECGRDPQGTYVVVICAAHLMVLFSPGAHGVAFS